MAMSKVMSLQHRYDMSTEFPLNVHWVNAKALNIHNEFIYNFITIYKCWNDLLENSKLIQI